MNNLESLNLTSKDFDLLISGLDALPSKGDAADMMKSLVISMVVKDDETRAKYERDEEIKKKNKEGERQLLIEEIKILQGKLLIFKRYLMENKLLKDANEILQS